MEQQPKKIRLKLSPQAEKVVRKDAPVEVRRMAAGGAVPLPPVELATVLFVLLHDPESEVKERAKQSLEGLPEGVLTTVLTGPTHPSVLSYLARCHEGNEGHCERLALNPHTDDATIAYLATLSHRRVVDIVSQNQERLARCDDIVEALGANPLTGRAVIERILTFLGVSESADEEPSDEAVSDEDAEAALAAILGSDMAHLAADLARESDDEFDDSAIEGNLYKALQTMTVMQKIKLARGGGSEARGLLVRDRNKVVASAAISNPRITDQEVIGLAASRGISEEVLRVIAGNREWTKKYQVKLSLATNPKVPQATALQFLNYLQDRDLKNVMKSKDVPSAVSTHARRILQKKGKV
ncbi:MAG: hypothetical protein MJE66_23760 [Proteobacteria bacterium]|nr:hypothetical protein [Pseudomonadota bacterium]